MPANDKPLAYYEHSQITAAKFFYKIDTWAQCYETICFRNLQNFVIR
jgi:hypothetical protein